MKLATVVKAIVISEPVTQKDIEETVTFLMQDNVLRDMKIWKRLIKKFNDEMEYETAQIH
jgi:hypothetical protein